MMMQMKGSPTPPSPTTPLCPYPLLPSLQACAVRWQVIDARHPKQLESVSCPFPPLYLSRLSTGIVTKLTLLLMRGRSGTLAPRKEVSPRGGERGGPVRIISREMICCKRQRERERFTSGSTPSGCPNPGTLVHIASFEIRKKRKKIKQTPDRQKSIADPNLT